MQTSRRAFLAYAAALGCAAAIPVPFQAVPAREFGFTFDDSLYQTGFPSREAAMGAAALDRPGAAFRTAEVAPHALRYPDGLGDLAAEWLLNGGRLGNAMAGWLECANEEGDFEGEFGDACGRASRAPLGDAGRAALAGALRRAGEPALAGDVLSQEAFEPREVPDPVLDALASDPALEAGLRAALAAWAEAEGLERELRGLRVARVEAHPAAALAA